MRIGYGRVLRRDRHPDAERAALRGAGCEKVFIDAPVGEAGCGPELDRALRVVRGAGDQLVVTRLERLCQSLEYLIEIVNQLQDRGADLVVLDPGIDTSTVGDRAFFPLLAAIGEFEHVTLSERTIAGLEAARARGRVGGPKPKLGPRQVDLVRRMYEEVDQDGKRRYTVQQIADEFGVTRPTIYRHLSGSR